jgi:hypothetical protein
MGHRRGEEKRAAEREWGTERTVEGGGGDGGTEGQANL